MNLLNPSKPKNDVFTYLMEWALCPGDLYWIKLNGKKVKMLYPGDFLDNEKIKKWMNSKSIFELDERINKKWTAEGVDLFHKLQSIEAEFKLKEEKKSIIRKDILSWFQSAVWNSDGEGNLLGLVLAMTKGFGVKDEIYEFVDSVSIERKVEGLVTASIVTCVALIYGYSSYSLLKELFIVIGMKDSSLLVGSLGVHGESELSEYMESKINRKQLSSDSLLRHTEESYKIAEKYLSRKIKNKYLLKLIKIHHEKRDGTGFPNGYCSQEMTELETIFVIVNSFTEGRVYNFDNSKELKILKKIIDKKEIYNYRFGKLVQSELDKVEAKEQDYLAVEGL